MDLGILLAASAGLLLAVLLAPSIRPTTQIPGRDVEPNARDEVLPALPASSSSRVEAVADAARDVSGSTRIVVRDSAGDPIDGANICRATSSRLRFVVDPPTLGTTGIDGMAVIEIEDPPSGLLIYRDGFQAGEVPGAARGQFYAVVLADGFEFRGLARLPDGSPLRDATVVLSGYGGIPADDVFPVADSLRPAARQRDAIYTGRTDSNGSVSVGGLPSGPLVVHAQHEAYCWVIPVSRIREISVPGPVYEFVFTEPATAAIRVEGDRIVYCNIGYEGQGSVSFANGWNSGVSVRQISRNLGETLPGLPETVHTVAAVAPEYRGDAIARFDAFLEGRGWWTIRVPMRALSDFEPAKFDLGSTPNPTSRASAELVWTARSPDGERSSFTDVVFGRSEGHHDMPVRVSIATDRPALLPPGEYRIIRPEHEYLSRATPRPSISVEAGPIQRQEWPLEQEVVAKTIHVSSGAGTVGSCRIRLQHEVLGDVTVRVRTQSVVLLPVGRIYFEAEAGAEFRLETGVLDVSRSSGDIHIHLEAI